MEGNEPEGSFYLTYHCEASVNSTTANATQGSDVLALYNSTHVVVGDILRINTLAGSTDGLLTDWEYLTIESVNGSQVTVDTAVSAATGAYYAEYGTFYSGPEMEFGVSTNCRQADPDFTNNPLDHDASSSALQDELQGLAQVNSSTGCLEVSQSLGIHDSPCEPSKKVLKALLEVPTPFPL